MNSKALLVISILLCTVEVARAQSAAFTYQGMLNDNGASPTGTYDLRFTLYDAVTGGIAIGSPLTVPGVNATNGLFTAQLDFGPTVFDGTARWLQLEVRTNGASGFTLLNPRQPITATPYAFQSANATTASNVTGSINDAQLSSNIARLNSAPSFTGAVTAPSFSGSGGNLTGLNAASISSGTVSVARGGTGANLSSTGGGGAIFETIHGWRFNFRWNDQCGRSSCAHS